MSFIILLISWLVYFVENNSDDEIEVKVTEQGLYISNVFYDYSTIKKYSVWYQNDSPNLLRLHLSKASVAILDLKISAEILSQVQFYINDFIENWWKSEITSTDKLIRFLNL
jgi:hypothetical protein